MSLLRVEDLRKYYPVSTGLFSKPKQVRAVDGISFHLDAGETLGLVGEADAGKVPSPVFCSVWKIPRKAKSSLITKIFVCCGEKPYGKNGARSR